MCVALLQLRAPSAAVSFYRPILLAADRPRFFALWTASASLRFDRVCIIVSAETPPDKPAYKGQQGANKLDDGPEESHVSNNNQRA